MKNVIFVLVALLLTGCGLGGRSSASPGATFYESLNLATPESAARTFLSAFQREDYPTIYLIFSFDTQSSFKSQLGLFRYAQVYKHGPDEAQNRVVLEEAILPPEKWEQTDQWWFFDQIMRSAAHRDLLLIDLRGDARINGTREAIAGESTPAVDVLASVNGIDGEVTLRMVQAPSGKWRVYQVIVPGGDESVIPWSAVYSD
ncbi:MAG: hypothetical protein OHK0046_12370 [Anaerolineae bacterium]